MGAAIEGADTGYIVRFDPWLFSSSEELVLRFLRELQAQLRGERQLAKAAARIGEYAEILAPVSALAGMPWLAVPLTIPGRMIRRLTKRQGAVSAQAQRRQVADALRALDRRLVVIIDDLDRLTRAEIRDVMRLVKLVGDFPNTTYVLAYDPARVAHALADDDDEDGHEFLEKIVQLTHDVPPINARQLTHVLGESINSAIGDLARYHFNQAHYSNLFAHCRHLFDNVRDVRRFTNVLPGTLALIGQEVELADVLTLEALRVRLPSTFGLIYAGRKALTEPGDASFMTAAGRPAAQEQVLAIVRSAGRFEVEVSEIIGRLFPAAAGYLGGTAYGSSWQATWRRERRVAHAEVFDIYLAKALPPGVLSVALVESALENLEDESALVTILAGLDDESLELLLDRLEHYEDDFPSTNPAIPVAALFNIQERLARPKRHGLDLGAGHRVPRIVLRLLRKLDAAETLRVVNEALPEIRSFSDKGRLIRMVGYREGSGHELIDEAAAAQLEAAFLDRLLEADASELLRERELIGMLLRAHSERPEQTQKRVQELIDSDEFALGLLRAALRETLTQELGDAAVQRSFDLDWNSLTVLIPAPILAERVAQLVATVDWEQLEETTRLALTQALERSQADLGAR